MHAESAVHTMLEQTREKLRVSLSAAFGSQVQTQLTVRHFCIINANPDEKSAQFRNSTDGQLLLVNYPPSSYKRSSEAEIATMRIAFVDESKSETTTAVGVRAYWVNFSSNVSELSHRESQNGGIHAHEVESLSWSIKIGKSDDNGRESWQPNEYSNMSAAVSGALHRLFSNP